ncbi:MAG: 5-dehydro-4-deoxyglucarate dehydratase, partial [Chloroflexota bacterium]|nr:5-dehydro-4-deoxyglucarate dehydratase [Chloroflexota bacterium]
MTPPESLKARIRGVLAFPITPYAADGRVDLDAVRANADWLPQAGIDAVVAPSGTGELFGLTPAEILEVIRATVEAIRGRIPVIASVGFGPRLAAELAGAAEDAGADGILVLPPYYATPDAVGLLEYYREVAAATSLGVMPYARDAAVFTPEGVERLAREVPNLVAFKDGRADVRLFQRIREHVVERLGPERLVWLAGAGDDLVGAYFAVGAEGYTSSLACFWPEASVELLRLARLDDRAQLASFHQRVVRPIYELRQRRRGYEVAVMKAAMELLGHRAGGVRPPLASLQPAERAELREILARLQVPTAERR